MSDRVTLACGAESAGARIDKYISDNIAELTRSAVQGLIAEGLVLADGKPVSKNYKLRGGETVEVEIPEPEPMDAVAEDIPLDIVYEDADLLVVNKPKGMVVHPAHGNYTGTLVNALLHHCGDSLSGINGVIRPGIVHRIDKDTSGLLVVAKNDAAHLSLAEQIKSKTCKREYLALLEGVVSVDNGHIATLIGRSPKDRKLMAVTKTGRVATTDYRVVERFKDYTLCWFSLGTGRTHQIRVHAKYLGHPVVGDKAYGLKKQKFELNGQLLHAFRLTLTHPRTGKIMTFEAPLPDYFENVLDILRKREGV